MSNRNSQSIIPAPKQEQATIPAPIKGKLVGGRRIIEVRFNVGRPRSEQYTITVDCACGKFITAYWYRLRRKAEKKQLIECQGCAVRRAHAKGKLNVSPEVLELAKQMLKRHLDALTRHGLPHPGEKELKLELWPETVDAARLEIEKGNGMPQDHDGETIYKDLHFRTLPSYVAPHDRWFN